LNIKDRTELAIIGMGVDSAKAHELRKAGHTATSLKQTSAENLKNLGISSHAINAFHTSKRPPIPPNTLKQVLYANRWSCCVCRNDKRPIVVHHLNPWKISHDHSFENLAVVCSIHHSKIHTKHELEQNLTMAMLSSHKKEWERQCREADNRLAMKDADLRFTTWFYFNHFRIHEMAKELGVIFKNIPGFQEAESRNICNKSGAIIKACPPDGFLFCDQDRLPLYDYISNLFFSCMQLGNISNISDYLDKGFFSGQILPGDIVMVQGLHTYTPVTPRPKGSEISTVLRKTNRVRIVSTINLEGATSTSSWCDWLRGQKNVCQILRVQEISRKDGNLVIEGTTLAIRSRDADFKHREYAARLWQTGLPYRHEEEDDEDDEIRGDIGKSSSEDPDTL
jgi:hypothetical protein